MGCLRISPRSRFISILDDDDDDTNRCVMKGRSGFLLLDFKLAVENFDERAGPKSFPILSRCKRRSEKK